MFTQCPKCQSVFMVSEKDARAHEGLVRCGNCYSVFNSSWNLTDDPRNEYIEEVSSIGKPVTAGGQGSGFTFSIMGSTAATPKVTKSDEETAEEIGSVESASLTDHESSAENTQEDMPPDEDLEPFPEPEMENFEDPLSVPEGKADEDSLLYFDANEDANEDDNNGEPVATLDNGPAPIEDLTLLQTPSFPSEIPDLDQDDRSLAPEDWEDAESGASGDERISDENMWPASEVNLESENESENDDAVADDVDATVEIESSTEESHDELPSIELIDDAPRELESLDEPVDEPLSGTQAVSAPVDEPLPEVPHAVEIHVDSDPLLSPIIEDQTEEGGSDFDAPPEEPALPGGEEDHWLDNVVTEAESIESMPMLEVDDDAPLPGEEENEHKEYKEDKSSGGDDTFYVAGEETDAEEFFSIDSLPKTADEAFSTDKNEYDAGDSVFITSEDEDVDESYVPISLKSGEQDELFHGLDEFPEPGELSALNYEDTMEINAMLEEANISKEQIESALSASEIASEDDEEGFAEEILLSSDAGNDLTDSLFPESGTKEVKAAGDRYTENRQNNFIVSFFKSLMPAGLGSKKAPVDQTPGDDHTQLIRSLSRSSSRSVMPRWVDKYAMPAVIGMLVVLLLAQVGYFYMDRLVRVTPLRPLLEAGCRLAGCIVPEVQNIDEIQQLSSRLTPLSGSDGGFKVSSILVNRGIRSQPFPALELILTDRAGNMISRRVVTPESYLASDKANVMKPNEAVDINIRFRTPSIRVDGFELRAVSQNWLE